MDVVDVPHKGLKPIVSEQGTRNKSEQAQSSDPVNSDNGN
jgi:hypothetical protein